MGHARTDTTRLYDRQAYQQEKKHAGESAPANRAGAARSVAGINLLLPALPRGGLHAAGVGPFPYPEARGQEFRFVVALVGEQLIAYTGYGMREAIVRFG